MMVLRVGIVAGFVALALIAMAVLRSGSGSAPERTASNPTPVLTFVPGTVSANVPTVTPTQDPLPGVTLGALDSAAPIVGDPAPDFQLQTADLKDVVRLSDLRGKPVVVNFWASWCGPCRAEMPDIQDAFESSKSAFHVVGVNEREPDLVARGFAYNLGVTFPLLLDLEASVGAQYRLGGLPATFFIDANGVLQAIQIGYMSKETLATRLLSVGITVEP